MNPTKKEIKYFWEGVEKRSLNDCWEWTWPIATTGYGVFIFRKNQIMAHRFSWLIHYGCLPKFSPYTKSSVCHKCDNRACVNPRHLFLGTQKNNLVDMVRKGRGSNQKLTEREVRRIRYLKNTGIPEKKIAETFSISLPHIYSIVNRRTWKHVK